MEWVLVIMLVTTKNEYVDKVAVPMPTEAVCIQAKRDLQGTDKLRPIGICVTKDHWTGKKPMAGVLFD